MDILFRQKCIWLWTLLVKAIYIKSETFIYILSWQVNIINGNSFTYLVIYCPRQEERTGERKKITIKC